MRDDEREDGRDDAREDGRGGERGDAPNDAVHGALSGEGVVVTGASRGLGRALARELARRGAKVVMVARELEPLVDLAAAIARDGGEAHALAADVGDKDAVHRISGAAAALVGDVAVLVNNASTLGHVPLRALVDTDCEALEAALAVNVVGPFRLAKALVGPMLLAGRGVVVNVSSDAGVEAYPRWGAYGASKAALAHLTRTFTAELEGRGVTFVSFDPGEMDTRMHADAIPDADPATLARPEHVARRLADLLARALAEAERSRPRADTAASAAARSA